MANANKEGASWEMRGRVGRQRDRERLGELLAEEAADEILVGE